MAFTFQRDVSQVERNIITEITFFEERNKTSKYNKSFLANLIKKAIISLIG